MNFVTNL